MIINTGQRTDIPAFYAQWFANRLKEGFVCVRNPYNPNQVSRYRLDPSVVDVIGFCTKNPAPMFPYMDLLKDYGQYWFVTITPYGRDIEPNVPDKHRLLDDFKRLSDMVGLNAIGWRYDPIFVSRRYTADYHIRAFGQIASAKLPRSAGGRGGTAAGAGQGAYQNRFRPWNDGQALRRGRRACRLRGRLRRLHADQRLRKGDRQAAERAEEEGRARGMRVLPRLRHRRLQHLQAPVQILLRKRGARSGTGVE